MRAVSWILLQPIITAVPALMLQPSLLRLAQPMQQVRMLAAPRRAGIESYQTVSVVCNKCRERLFRYKKKNGLKSALVKCYVERITEDPGQLLSSELGASTEQGGADPRTSAIDRPREYACPKCASVFARSASIHGRPALKMAGGKVRMTK